MPQNQVNNKDSNLRKEVYSYLLQYKEDVPQWLKDYGNGMPISFADVMSGRVGYYPGSRFDGTLIKLGNKSHAVHSFLYVDYDVSREEMENHLAEPNSLRGYHSIGRIEWKESDMLPNGQYVLNVYDYPRLPSTAPRLVLREKPYCFTEILERNADCDDSWGSERFALTLLFADGIATYYNLFCREYNKAPWIMLLQDHGFGGNYDRFGKNGLLDAIIHKNNIRPTFVICDKCTRIWDGYEIIPNLIPISRPTIRDERQLFKNVKV